MNEGFIDPSLLHLTALGVHPQHILTQGNAPPPPPPTQGWVNPFKCRLQAFLLQVSFYFFWHSVHFMSCKQCCIRVKESFPIVFLRKHQRTVRFIKKPKASL